MWASSSYSTRTSLCKETKITKTSYKDWFRFTVYHNKALHLKQVTMMKMAIKSLAQCYFPNFFGNSSDRFYQAQTPT